MNTRLVSNVESPWTVSAAVEGAACLAAEAANDLQFQLLMRIGREIKAPLGAVLGFAHLMSQDPVDPLGDRHRRWVGLIEQAAHYMLSLVNESLQVADDGTVPLPEAELAVELPVLLSEVGALLSAHAASRLIDVRVEPTCAIARAQPRALRQVLLNLGSNAIKYNREGGQVTVSARTVGETVGLQVRDNGLGMSEAMCGALFQPYNRLGRESSAVEGTGLGLCIVRQLVEGMGGRIEVDSAVGQGTTVRVMLAAA
jgi:signal transduction histidine kinase